MGCIYMYTNKINGMKYVGQTICKLSKRHNEHIKRDNSYIDMALRKYGEDNFTLEILEDNISDADTLNNREIYWINFYDSFNHGYNLTKGGSGGSTFNTEEALKIIDLLRSSADTMKEIGEKFGYSVYTISDINRGNICFQDNIEYPIRKNRITQKYNQDNLDVVIDLLKNTEYTFQKISEITDTKFSYVNDVNRGKVNGDYHGYTTPIRKYKYDKSNMTKELALQIIDYLKKDYSAEQISNIVHVPSYTVGQINRGKMAICKDIFEDYPIQKRQHRNKESSQKSLAKLTPSDVYEIVELLLNTSLSLEEISRRYSVDKYTIDRINQKKTWKNLLSNYEAPIRTNPKNQISQ